jgi:hypothetical protein
MREAGAPLEWLLVSGCGPRSQPGAGPTSELSPEGSPAPARAVVGSGPEQGESPIKTPAATSSAPSWALTMTPEAFTITAPDPGVQLLVSRQNADGTVRDLTSRVAWQVDPPGVATIEQGGYLRPLTRGADPRPQISAG